MLFAILHAGVLVVVRRLVVDLIGLGGLQISDGRDPRQRRTDLLRLLDDGVPGLIALWFHGLVVLSAPQPRQAACDLLVLSIGSNVKKHIPSMS